MNPLAAVWRWCKAFLYLVTGQIDKSRRVLDKNPSVMQAKFDDIIKGKVDQIHTYKQAVAKLIAQQEKKMAKLKTLTEETKKLETLKAGALAMAKQTVSKLQNEGQTKEEIHASEQYRNVLPLTTILQPPLLKSRTILKTSRVILLNTMRVWLIIKSTCSS